VSKEKFCSFWVADNGVLCVYCDIVTDDVHLGHQLILLVPACRSKLLCCSICKCFDISCNVYRRKLLLAERSEMSIVSQFRPSKHQRVSYGLFNDAFSISDCVLRFI
jgi:hypothetical protein